jgi:hypothetical protein
LTTTINASASAGLVQTADTSTILQLQTASTAALTIDASQNVGIGVASSLTGKLSVGTVSYGQTSPVAQVNGASKAISNNGGILSIGSTDAAGADIGGSLGFTANSAGNGYATGQISGRKVNGSDYSSYMAFTTCDSGGTLTEKMRINSSGNVGIGTTSPQRKLSIVGTDGASGQTEGNSRTSLFLDNNGANYLTIMTGTSGDGGVFFSDNGQNNGGMVYETSSDALYFRANNAERMRIDSSGNMYVGAQVIISGNQGGNFWISNTTSSSAYNQFQFKINGTGVGQIQTSGSSTAYQTSSDYRLKENIQPMQGALAKVSQLKPVTYKWKIDGSDGQGFIAHELQEIIPDCVGGTKDATRQEEYEVTPAVKDEQGNITTPAVMGTRTVPSYQGVDTSFLVATLTAAIQELKAINDQQAETINALTARIVALESKA